MRPRNSDGELVSPGDVLDDEEQEQYAREQRDRAPRARMKTPRVVTYDPFREEDEAR